MATEDTYITMEAACTEAPLFVSREMTVLVFMLGSGLCVFGLVLLATAAVFAHRIYTKVKERRYTNFAVSGHTSQTELTLISTTAPTGSRIEVRSSIEHLQYGQHEPDDVTQQWKNSEQAGNPEPPPACSSPKIIAYASSPIPDPESTIHYDCSQWYQGEAMPPPPLQTPPPPPRTSPPSIPRVPPRVMRQDHADPHSACLLVASEPTLTVKNVTSSPSTLTRNESLSTNNVTNNQNATFYSGTGNFHNTYM